VVSQAETTRSTTFSRDDVLLEVRDLEMYFPVTAGIIFQRKIADVKAVDGISFNIRRGEVFGLAGESGSGKTTTGRLIVRLVKPTEGHILFEGTDIAALQTDVFVYHP